MENEILFENVSFSYDGKEVFRNLNVRIPSDRHVALVGENGAGKSTFIKLLLGLYEPKQGSILVDGRPVKDRTPKERKRLFAAAFQDFYRYPLSVKENLSMCQNGEKTTADYIAALEMVGLEINWIIKLENTGKIPRIYRMDNGRKSRWRECFCPMQKCFFWTSRRLRWTRSGNRSCTRI